MTTTDSANFGLWSWAALVVALAGTAGSIYLSTEMSLIPCPLCYYQRTFVMAAFGVLAVGLLAGTQHAGFASLLALPLALGGLGVAGRHVGLEASGAMECPAGILALGTAPQQSLALFIVLTLLLLVDVLVRAKMRLAAAPAAIGAVVLGALLAVGSVMSAKPPEIPKEGKLIGCRPLAK